MHLVGWVNPSANQEVNNNSTHQSGLPDVAYAKSLANRFPRVGWVSGSTNIQSLCRASLPAQATCWPRKSLSQWLAEPELAQAFRGVRMCPNVYTFAYLPRNACTLSTQQIWQGFDISSFFMPNSKMGINFNFNQTFHCLKQLNQNVYWMCTT